MQRIEIAVQRSPRGDFIASVFLPKVLGDRCHGWHKKRSLTPEHAVDWAAAVVRNHLTKRVLFRESARAMRAKEHGE